MVDCDESATFLTPIPMATQSRFGESGKNSVPVQAGINQAGGAKAPDPGRRVRRMAIPNDVDKGTAEAGLFIRRSSSMRTKGG
jgi:hypothetical protein